MTNYEELVVSARDAEALAPIVGNLRDAGRFEADAADALADMLMDARRVPHERLPADRVAMNSRVTYSVEPQGNSRTVVLVRPGEANASEGRISVLSPIGRALLGRKPGSVSATDVPGGGALKIRVLEVERLSDSPAHPVSAAPARASPVA